MMENKKVRPQDKWNEKAGYMSKTYKLKREDVEAFKEACDLVGDSQASVITKAMKDYISKANQK